MHPRVGKIGMYGVTSEPMLFVDRSRPDLGARRLPTLLSYPVVPAGEVASGKMARGPFPLDPAKIAVAGHSDGGDTAAAVAADTCCRDRRVSAALILSGAEWPPLGGRYFPAGTPPMLVVQGTDDTWNPPQASIQLYRSDTAGVRYYLSLINAGHFTPYEGHGKPEPLVARVTVAFLNRYLSGQAGQASALETAGHVPGVAELGRDGRLPG